MASMLTVCLKWCAEMSQQGARQVCAKINTVIGSCGSGAGFELAGAKGGNRCFGAAQREGDRERTQGGGGLRIELQPIENIAETGVGHGHAAACGVTLMAISADGDGGRTVEPQPEDIRVGPRLRPGQGDGVFGLRRRIGQPDVEIAVVAAGRT